MNPIDRDTLRFKEESARTLAALVKQIPELEGMLEAPMNISGLQMMIKNQKLRFKRQRVLQPTDMSKALQDRYESWLDYNQILDQAFELKNLSPKMAERPSEMVPEVTAGVYQTDLYIGTIRNMIETAKTMNQTTVV